MDDDINGITNECESSGYRQPFEKMFLRRCDVVPEFFLGDIPRGICRRQRLPTRPLLGHRDGIMTSIRGRPDAAEGEGEKEKEKEDDRVCELHDS